MSYISFNVKTCIFRIEIDSLKKKDLHSNRFQAFNGITSQLMLNIQRSINIKDN